MTAPCPIALTMDVLGDRWSLVVLRDIMFGGRRTFRDLLSGSPEGIASNILSARLKRLVAEGLLTKRPDPGHSQRVHYTLTAPAIALVPVMATLSAWGRAHRPGAGSACSCGQLAQLDGAADWQAVMDALTARHLADPEGGLTAPLPPILARLATPPGRAQTETMP
ncbi:winged helix-turn-helix transcriptional regulator [Wenxinia saemankumensis]|nr:helix-turn-helix domain-containing protein [Wenxinia saemankumensis]